MPAIAGRLSLRPPQRRSLEILDRITEIVKAFMLIIARDTPHAGQLIQHIQSEKFFESRYKEKVIQVDSSKTGAEEDEMIERLLKVESPEEPTEIVIHVNMLKEGWDVIVHQGVTNMVYRSLFRVHSGRNFGG